jgi:hypothetical protein
MAARTPLVMVILRQGAKWRGDAMQAVGVYRKGAHSAGQLAVDVGEAGGGVQHDVARPRPRRDTHEGRALPRGGPIPKHVLPDLVCAEVGDEEGALVLVQRDAVGVRAVLALLVGPVPLVWTADPGPRRPSGCTGNTHAVPPR